MTLDDLTNSEIAALIDEYIHSARDREILKDRYIDGLTHAAIAEKRDCSERNVRNILYKSQEKLFRALDKLFSS